MPKPKLSQEAKQECTRRNGQSSLQRVQFVFLSRLKKLQYAMLYYTVPSIVNKDIKLPGFHYGWHLTNQINFLYKTKNKTTTPRHNTHKRQQNKAKADYWSKELELFNS